MILTISLEVELAISQENGDLVSCAVAVACTYFSYAKKTAIANSRLRTTLIYRSFGRLSSRYLRFRISRWPA
jgi:hypothetical protein